jgi:hypothetical protein
MCFMGFSPARRTAEGLGKLSEINILWEVTSFVNAGWFVLVWFYDVQCHFQLYFNYIVAVSFIGGGPGENHRPVASHWQTLSHNVVSSTLHHERGSNSQSNYHTITTTPKYRMKVLVCLIISLKRAQLISQDLFSFCCVTLALIYGRLMLTLCCKKLNKLISSIRNSCCC